ncbi:hypothetical protein WJX73_000930 [Symbiochloris irregularis]|uniref:Uncharacterized protein n=1 Tax=Symbiochloris irregularis TaxID=706552 RepID=A0AAW1NXF3_9CHLO
MGRQGSKENVQPNSAKRAAKAAGPRASNKRQRAEQMEVDTYQSTYQSMCGARAASANTSPASLELNNFCASLRSARINPTRAMTSSADVVTFDQVATARNTDTAPEVDELLGSFLGRLNSNGATSNSCHSADTRLAAPAYTNQRPPKAPPRTESLLQSGLTAPPVDWSLKTGLRFSSAQPFDCCDQALMARPSTVCAALQGFASGRSLASGGEEQFLHALLSWQYPQRSMDPKLIQSLSASSEGQKMMTQRREVWEEAARCLVGAVRSCTCDAFYLMSAQGARRPFVAFFGASGVGGKPRAHAWLSHSTRGLRNLLRNPPHGLSFSMPLASEADALEKSPAVHCQATASQFYGSRDALAASKDAMKAVAAIDGTARSLLLFQGAGNVQGLFDYLLAGVMEESATTVDVPSLLAPVPFPGACLHQLHAQALPVSAAQAGSGKGGHRFEVKGQIPPWCAWRLSCVLRDFHTHDFQVVMETDKLTQAFNFEAVSGNSSQASCTQSTPTDYDFARRHAALSVKNIKQT